VKRAGAKKPAPQPNRYRFTLSLLLTPARMNLLKAQAVRR
jgi:hypothetical protein